MAYAARVILDSLSPRGHRLATFEATFPRKVLAEVVTHRVVYEGSEPVHFQEDLFSNRSATRDVSKNSGSSRAIPFTRMLQAVMDDPYIPERFTKNGPGMQGHGYLEGESHDRAVNNWLRARDEAVGWAKHMHDLGVHKQEVNRLLEPWAWVTQILTATQWNNFFALRCHKDADPAFQKIARLMYLAYRNSTPTRLDYNEWHLPYVGQGDLEDMRKKLWDEAKANEPGIAERLGDGSLKHPEFVAYVEIFLPIYVSAVRAAWVSYNPPDAQKYTLERAIKTWVRMSSSSPLHASPTEHQGTPMSTWDESMHPEWRSNLQGWLQFRKQLPRENITEYDPSSEEIASWNLTPPSSP